MKHILLGLVLAGMALCLGGCGLGGSGSVTIDPTSVALVTGQSQVFSATITQCPGSKVEWSVQEGFEGGSITDEGVYTAPAAPGTYHVVATCADDRGISSTATVTVN